MNGFKEWLPIGIYISCVLLICGMATTPAMWAAWLTPDHTQAGWELGSACLQLLNVRAIRRSRSISGVHWLPTAFFSAWGIYNLWFYAALGLPISWWAGIAITVVNLTWLGHLWYYSRKGKSNVQF